MRDETGLLLEPLGYLDPNLPTYPPARASPFRSCWFVTSASAGTPANPDPRVADDAVWSAGVPTGATSVMCSGGGLRREVTAGHGD